MDIHSQKQPIPPPPSPSSISSASQLPPHHLLTQSDAATVGDHHHYLPSLSPNPEKTQRQIISKQRNSAPAANFNKQIYPGLLGLAALARDRTSSAIASFTEPALRTRHSSNSLHRLSLAPGSNSIVSKPNPRGSATTQVEIERPSTERPVPLRRASQASTIRAVSPEAATHPSQYRQSLLETNPPSQAYKNISTGSSPPSVSLPSGNYNKMHQTSLRLLRMTDDERPFTRV